MAIKTTTLDDFFAEEPMEATKNVKTYSRYKIYEEPPMKNRVGQPQTKGEQKGNKRGTQTITKGEQKGNKRGTQHGIKGEQKGNKRGTQTITKRGTKEGSGYLPSNILPTVSSLVGLQRKITFAIYQSCKLNGGNITPTMTLEHLALTIGTKKSIAKTTINRLKKKKYVEVASFKAGRGGWIKYKLPQNVYVDLLRHEGLYLPSLTDLNFDQKGNKRVTQTVTQTVTPTLSSSSNYKNTINTITNDIDITPLESIGFGYGHLKQLINIEDITTEIIQTSINHFAYDLNYNNKADEIRKKPIAYFMGSMKKYGCYNAPDGYESPKDKAMRLYLERMRKIEQVRVDEEKEAFNLAFSDWFSKLSNEQKRELLPEMLRRTANLETSKILENTAKSHFEKEIWAVEKIKIITQK